MLIASEFDPGEPPGGTPSLLPMCHAPGKKRRSTATDLLCMASPRTLHLSVDSDNSDAFEAGILQVGKRPGPSQFFFNENQLPPPLPWPSTRPHTLESLISPDVENRFVFFHTLESKPSRVEVRRVWVWGGGQRGCVHPNIVAYSRRNRG